MKYQRLISRIILGLAFICLFIPPGSCLEMGVNVLSENTTILNAEPSGDFNLSVDESQLLTLTLDRDVTAVWFVDDIEIQTDHNTTTPDYYFFSSSADDFNVTVNCRDSLTNTSQVNFTWVITVSSVEPYPTTPRAVSPGGGTYTPPELTTEDVDVEPPTIWDKAEEFDDESDVDNTILGLGTLFSLLFLYTLKKGGGGAVIPGRDAPLKL